MAGHNRNLQPQNQLVRNFDFDFKRKAGRPRKFSSPEEFEEAITKYFGSITSTYPDRSGKVDNNGEPVMITEVIEAPTISGLRNYLGISPDTWCEYAKKDGYSESATHAKSIIEAYLEQQLFTSKNTQGIIFNLKNNFGWADKIETKNENMTTVNVEGIEDFLKGEGGGISM